MKATTAVLALAAILVGCSPTRRDAFARLSAPAGPFNERVRVMTLDSGVTATIIAPAAIDVTKRVELILYALPNGNSTAETMGRKLVEGIGWRYDIQHIAAQTRALRTQGADQAIVVYLEVDGKSWPEWRRRQGYDRANARIVAMVDELRAEFGDATPLAVTLTGHSGGGSFAFGFIEGRAELPAWLERIAFLDSNYSYEQRHFGKIAAWLRGDASRTLVVLAYDDREIMLDGKKVVSDSGGTWRATRRMLDHFRGPFALAPDTLGEFLQYRSAQIEMLVHPNPSNRILHTVMIGEMNGYMHALLARRPHYETGPSILRATRAYEQWVDANAFAPPPRSSRAPRAQ